MLKNIFWVSYANKISTNLNQWPVLRENLRPLLESCCNQQSCQLWRLKFCIKFTLIQSLRYHSNTSARTRNRYYENNFDYPNTIRKRFRNVRKNEVRKTRWICEIKKIRKYCPQTICRTGLYVKIVKTTIFAVLKNTVLWKVGYSLPFDIISLVESIFFFLRFLCTYARVFNLY